MGERLVDNAELTKYIEIAKLDPLHLDNFMAVLPELNATNNLEKIKLRTHEAVSDLETTDSFTPSRAYAALRDLDFLVSSILRHGENPIESIAGLESQLMRLGGITGTVPRGTVFTYAALNPEGERRRSFTGSPEEESFIDAVAKSVHRLDGATEALSSIEYGESSSEHLADALLDTEDAMQQMIQSIASVHRAVSPEFFTFHLRPYFDSLVINGNTYTGAGGAQIQLLTLDYMLWGASNESPEYEQFFQDNYPYLIPSQQEAIYRFIEANNGKTIVDSLVGDQSASTLDKQLALTVLKTIKKFRFPHRRVAQENFKLRSHEAVGSGNFRPDILDTLIEKTEEAMTRVESSMR